MQEQYDAIFPLTIGFGVLIFRKAIAKNFYKHHKNYFNIEYPYWFCLGLPVVAGLVAIFVGCKMLIKIYFFD